MVGAGPAGLADGHHAGRARPRGAPVRSRGRRSAASSTWPSAFPGKEEFQRDAALLRVAGSRLTGVTASPGHARRCRHARGAEVRCRRCWPPASRARDPKIPGQRRPERAELHRRAAARQAGRRAGGHRRRRRHRLRRGRVPGHAAEGHSPTLNLKEWLAEWGVADPEPRCAAAWCVPSAARAAGESKVTLLQRKAGKLGKGLGKTTGWIHRAALQMKQVEMIGGVNYERITSAGPVRHLRREAPGRPADRVRHRRALRRPGTAA